MILSINQVFSLGSGMKCRGIVLRSAYEDILALFKLKRKEQGQAPSNDSAPENQDYYEYDHHMSDFLQLVPYVDLIDPTAASVPLSTQPSAPPIPDCHNIPEGHCDEDNNQNLFYPNIGTKANNLLAYFEVHEQVDFKGIGLVDVMYVPYLEQVCHTHPCLIECQRKRTPQYSGWAFTALGRVLHFLETTKVAEMNEDACECLKQLWDEVKVFGFDLSWLAPQVEFTFRMKGCVETLRKVKKLEEEKRSMEMRIQELSMKLVEMEKEIERSKSDKGFKISD